MTPLIATVALIILAAGTTPARAACPRQWTPMATAEAGRETCFNLGQVTRAGDWRQVQALSSWSARQTLVEGLRFRSVRQTALVDCAGGRAGIRAMRFFAGRGGQGALVRTIDVDPDRLPWDEALPAEVLAQVCAAPLAP